MIEWTRASLRRMWRRPETTLRGVAVVAVVVWANAVLFALVSSWLWAPLPFPDGERLLKIWEIRGDAPDSRSDVSPATFMKWLEEAQTFVPAAYFQAGRPALLCTGAGHAVEPVQITVTSGPFAEVLGVAPRIGSFGDEPGQVVISHGLWSRVFGSKPDILGESLRLDGRSVSVAGVMPPSFSFPQATDIWRSVPLGREMGARQRSSRYLEVVARRLPDAEPRQVEGELKTLSEGLAESFPDTHGPWQATHQDLHGAQTAEMRPALSALAVAAMFLLLLGFANLAILVSGDVVQRRSEVAIRRALGASQGQISTMMVLETTLTAALGGMIGLQAARWTVTASMGLWAAAFPFLSTEIDVPLLPIFLVTVGLGALVGGIASSSSTSRDLVLALRNGRSVSPGALGFGRWLTVVQVTLAVWVLATSTLFVRSFFELASTDPGFAVDGRQTLKFRWQLEPGQKVMSVAEPMVSIRRALQELPEIEAVAVTSHQPLADVPMRESFSLEGSELSLAAQLQSVGPDYFDVLRIPVLSGRPFSDQDRLDGQPVAVVNQSAAQILWPQGLALGNVVTRSLTGTPLTVVGVVADTRAEALRQDPGPQIYVPFSQAPMAFGRFTLVTSSAVKSGTDTSGWESQARATVAQLDPRLRIFDPQPLKRVIDDALPQSRLVSATLVALGALSLLLSSAGLFAVVSRSVGARRREMGIRRAVGAGPSRLVAMMLSQELRHILVGVPLGLAATLLSARLFGSFLFGITTSDPLSLTCAALVVILTAVLSTLGSIRAAAFAPPATILRDG